VGHKAVQECADTYHHQPVEDIRADDITDGDIITASQGSIDADGSLRRAGAHGHDGQSNDDAGDLQDPREELPSTKKSAPLIRSINPTSNNMYSISCPFLQQASVFLEKSIKIETFTASKMIDKSLVAYNNNRSDGRDDDYHSGQLHVSFSYYSIRNHPGTTPS
jgi:hypothetical protein